MEPPSYIKSLLIPNGKKPAGRRVWSIDLETVWLPFFTATNTMGDTHIAPDALGAPLRLNYNQDGSVKFSKSGRPVIAVSKELAQNVRLVRENFTAGLQHYANAVITENPDGYRAMVEMAGKAGESILVTDRRNLDKAMLERMEEAIAEAACYLFTASLTAPIGSDWTQIYLYVAGGEMKDKMPEDIKVEALTESQWCDLKELKNWIYRQRSS